MRLRFLKLVNGWGGFLTELAIVVFGVLIALGAQQLLDDWQGKRNVADFREALDAELSGNLRAETHNHHMMAAARWMLPRKLAASLS